MLAALAGVVHNRQRAVLLTVPLAPEHDYSAVPLAPPSTDFLARNKPYRPCGTT